MVNQDLTALTETTNPASTDIAYTVTDPGGARNPRKSLWSNILKIYDELTATLTNKTYSVDGTGNVLKQQTPSTGQYLRDNGTKFVGSSIQAEDLPSGIDATKIGGGEVTSTEFGYIGGLTSDAQTQLNTKASLTGSETLTNKKLTDTTTEVISNSDNTKKLKISLADQTTGKTITLKSDVTVDTEVYLI
jgi:hypothetical protein